MKKLFCLMIILLLFSLPCVAHAYERGEAEQTGAYVEETVALMQGLVSSPSASVTPALLSSLCENFGFVLPMPENDRTVDRGEFCTAAYFLLRERCVLPPAGEELSFRDLESEEIPAVSTLVKAGVLGGYADGTFRSSQAITAAEAAVAVGRLRVLLEREPRYPGTPAGSVEAGPPEERDSLSTACVIGHSHAVGMSMTLDTDMVDYYAISGMSAVGILSSDKFLLPDGTTGSLYTALSRRSYERVYVILGTNDMPGGFGNLPRFRSAMQALIRTIRDLQDGAEIYLLAIAPVARGYYGYTPGFSLDYIVAYNQCLKSLARDYRIEYLDDFTPLATPEGMMRPEYDRGDALHFSPEGYNVMLQTILTHIRRSGRPA